MEDRTKTILWFSLLLVFVVAISVSLFFIDPRKIVERVGVENTYWIGFGVAVLGGVSTFTAASFYAVMYTLSNGGANPFLLGLAAGIGLAISDSFFYYLGTKGKQSLSEGWKKKLEWIPRWINKRGDRTMGILVFVYTGLTPLPNDILTVAAALSEFEYKKLIVPLLLGDILSATIIALLASEGIKLFALIL